LSALEIPVNDLRDRQKYPLQETSLHRVVMALAGLLFRAVIDLNVTGLEDLPSTKDRKSVV